MILLLLLNICLKQNPSITLLENSTLKTKNKKRQLHTATTNTQLDYSMCVASLSKEDLT